MALSLQVMNGTAPRRSAQVTRSASKDKENAIFGSSENDSSGTAVVTTARVAKTELAKLKKAPDQVTAERDAARTEVDAIRSARGAIHSERDDATDANVPIEGLEAELGVANEDTGLGFVNVTTLAENIAGLEAALNGTNDDADAGLLRATSLVENNVRGLDDADNDADDDADGDADGNADLGLEADVHVVELCLNGTNDGSDAGLLRATALAENVSTTGRTYDDMTKSAPPHLRCVVRGLASFLTNYFSVIHPRVHLRVTATFFCRRRPGVEAGSGRALCEAVTRLFGASCLREFP